MDQEAVLNSLDENASTEAEFLANLEMYATGTPIEYILEKFVIQDHAFFVDRRVHIPDPKCAAIVDLAADLLPQNGMAIDVGTGCGWIGILTKKWRPDANVVLTDLDGGSLEVAKVNARAHDADVALLRSHLLARVEFETRPDLVIANLSYGISKTACQKQASDADAYLPTSPLFSEASPLSVYSDLVRNISELGFAPNFLFEVGLFEDKRVHQDLQFEAYATEIVRQNGFGFTILRRR